jgi:hypothetical protein
MLSKTTKPALPCPLLLLVLCTTISITLFCQPPTQPPHNEQAIPLPLDSGSITPPHLIEPAVYLGDDSVGCQKLSSRAARADEIVIDSLPYCIDSAGSYILTRDLVSPSSGILIYASDVTLDLNGHSITYSSAVTPTPPGKRIFTYNGLQEGNVGHHAICSPNRPDYTYDWNSKVQWNKLFHNVTIKNGVVLSGESAGLSYSPALLLDGITHKGIIENVAVGIDTDDSEALIAGKNFLIRNCTIFHSGTVVSNRHQQLGVVILSDSAEIQRSLIYGGPQVGIKGAPNALIHHNSIKLFVTATNGYAVQRGSPGMKVYNNKIIHFAGRGIHITGDGWEAYDNYIESRIGANAEYGSMDVHGIKFENATNTKVYRNIVVCQAVTNGSPTALNFGIKPNANNVAYDNIFYAINNNIPTVNTIGIYLVSTDGEATRVHNNHFELVGTTNTYGVSVSWDGAKNHRFEQCSFNASQKNTLLFMPQMGNNNTAHNIVFKDCLFSPTIDKYSLTSTARSGSGYDYHFEWTLNLIAPEGALVRIVNETGSVIHDGSVGSTGHATLTLPGISVVGSAQSVLLVNNTPLKLTLTAANQHRSFKLLPRGPLELVVDTTGLDSLYIVTPTSPPLATQGQSYALPLQATGSDSTRWTIEGTLPPGLEFNDTTLTGTPAVSGSYSLTLRAQAGSLHAEKQITLLINPNPYVAYKALIDAVIAGHKPTFNPPAKNQIASLYGR